MKNWLKNVCTLIAVALFAGCGKPYVNGDVMKRRAAVGILQKDLQLRVIGFSKIIGEDSLWSKLLLEKGSFDVIVEYVNHNGGLDRTNFPVIYFTSTNAGKTTEISCLVDDTKIQADELQKFLDAHKVIKSAVPTTGIDPQTGLPLPSSDPRAINPMTGLPFK